MLKVERAGRGEEVCCGIFLIHTHTHTHTQEWGHDVLFLHVDVSNVKAISFYKNIGFGPLERDIRVLRERGRDNERERARERESVCVLCLSVHKLQIS